ncbi:unnamed protein product [Lota lota]
MNQLNTRQPVMISSLHLKTQMTKMCCSPCITIRSLATDIKAHRHTHTHTHTHTCTHTHERTHTHTHTFITCCDKTRSLLNAVCLGGREWGGGGGYQSSLNSI